MSLSKTVAHSKLDHTTDIVIKHHEEKYIVTRKYNSLYNEFLFVWGGGGGWDFHSCARCNTNKAKLWRPRHKASTGQMHSHPIAYKLFTDGPHFNLAKLTGVCLSSLTLAFVKINAYSYCRITLFKIHLGSSVSSWKSLQYQFVTRRVVDTHWFHADPDPVFS
jgi:hypothetical protein